MTNAKLAILFTILLLNPFSKILFSQPASEKRNYSRSLFVEKEARVAINNRYGDIHLKTWNKDSVLIRVEIEATANNSSKLKNLLEGIDINISGTSRSVKAETLFEKELTVLRESFKGFTEKIIDYESKIRINYYIYLPENIDLDIRNQFGDVTIDNNNGTVSVSLSNGSFRAGSLNRISELNLDFCETEIGSVKKARIITTFSKFLIREAGEINLTSTGSKYEIGTAGNLTFESRRDKFHIDNTSGMHGTSYFTDFKIITLDGKNDLNLKFGSFDADKTEGSFEKINISSSNANITLGFEASFSSRFVINHSNAQVTIPDVNTRSDEEITSERKKEYSISGTIGNTPGSREIRIEANRGIISLQYRQDFKNRA